MILIVALMDISANETFFMNDVEEVLFDKFKLKVQNRKIIPKLYYEMEGIGSKGTINICD